MNEGFCVGFTRNVGDAEVEETDGAVEVGEYDGAAVVAVMT